jgi:hypothetical protein
VWIKERFDRCIIEWYRFDDPPLLHADLYQLIGCCGGCPNVSVIGSEKVMRYHAFGNDTMRRNKLNRICKIFVSAGIINRNNEGVFSSYTIAEKASEPHLPSFIGQIPFQVRQTVIERILYVIYTYSLIEIQHKSVGDVVLKIAEQKLIADEP